MKENRQKRLTRCRVQQESQSAMSCDQENERQVVTAVPTIIIIIIIIITTDTTEKSKTINKFAVSGHKLNYVISRECHKERIHYPQ